MGDGTITVIRHDTAALIRLDRPEARNAISMALMRDLTEAVRSASGDAGVRSVVIAGNDRAFSSGRDLKEASRTTSAQAVEAWSHLTETMERAPVPIIAAIEGYCLTGGLELALACDIRIAGENATFAITSARLGTVPGFGATQRLPRTIGTARALELLFSAEAIDADEAYRIGLIHRRVAAGGSVAAALDLAALYAERAPLSLSHLKKAVRQGMETDLASGLALERRLGAELTLTRDRQEGMAAFIEKRKPRFEGR
jgi:enoyl-CoA hydratase/carnithine racemase